MVIMENKIKELVKGLTTLKQVERVLTKNNINYRIDKDTYNQYGDYCLWVGLIRIQIKKTTYSKIINGKEKYCCKNYIYVSTYKKEPLISQKAYESYKKFEGILY